MDYERIYREFIADRKRKPTPEGYTERHHIVPRSLGGSNESENLIDLTAEDHFFAHLLLAKAHGGKMGSALALMTTKSKRHWRQRFRSRAAYDLAQKIAVPALREAFAGTNNPLYNGQEFDWLNLDDGRRVRATMFQMHLEHGGRRPGWSQCTSGSRHTYMGWTLADRKVRIRGTKGFRHKFVNRDGQRFEGTQKEFCLFAGLNDASSWRVVHQRSVTRCGWRLAGTDDRQHNCPRSGDRPGPQGAVIRLVRGGTVIEGDRQALAKKLSSTPGQISTSVYAMRKGKVSGYKGWSLAS